MKGISQRQVFAAIGAVEALKVDDEGSGDDGALVWNMALDAARKALFDALTDEDITPESPRIGEAGNFPDQWRNQYDADEAERVRLDGLVADPRY